MPIEPVKIPQNVQIEDRIIGPVTLRQLIITIVGCGISYVLWSGLEKAFGTVSVVVTIIAWIPALIFVAFAFVKVYDVSLLRMIILLIERGTKPQTRVWVPRADMIVTGPRACTEPEKKKADSGAAQEQQPSIEELSSILDTRSGEAPKPLVPSHHDIERDSPVPSPSVP